MMCHGLGLATSLVAFFPFMELIGAPLPPEHDPSHLVFIDFDDDYGRSILEFITSEETKESVITTTNWKPKQISARKMFELLAQHNELIILSTKIPFEDLQKDKILKSLAHGDAPIIPWKNIFGKNGNPDSKLTKKNKDPEYLVNDILTIYKENKNLQAKLVKLVYIGKELKDQEKIVTEEFQGREDAVIVRKFEDGKSITVIGLLEELSGILPWLTLIFFDLDAIYATIYLIVHPYDKNVAALLKLVQKMLKFFNDQEGVEVYIVNDSPKAGSGREKERLHFLNQITDITPSRWHPKNIYSLTPGWRASEQKTNAPKKSINSKLHSFTHIILQPDTELVKKIIIIGDVPETSMAAETLKKWDTFLISLIRQKATPSIQELMFEIKTLFNLDTQEGILVKELKAPYGNDYEFVGSPLHVNFPRYNPRKLGLPKTEKCEAVTDYLLKTREDYRQQNEKKLDFPYYLSLWENVYCKTRKGACSYKTYKKFKNSCINEDKNQMPETILVNLLPAIPEEEE